MRYFILIIALFIATLSFSQGGKLIRIKVNKGETGNTGLTGPSGADGDDGREVELQNSGTYIQWRYVGDVSWTNLIDIVTITGADGSDGIDGADGTEIELQNSGTYIQWRYVGAGSWTNLIAISAITGADGSDGADGVDGSTWYDGTGAPAGGLGIDGDYYLNDANGDVYIKASGSWSVTANIKGADGLGAGTVTVVTGSAPIVITSTATTTPNVTIDTTSSYGAGTQYDLSLKENKLTGTAGQTLRFTGTNTVAASSFIYNNGSSIGINNTSPSGSFTVNGASYFNSQTPFNLYNVGGTGIYTSFQDASYVDNLVYSGAATGKTFTLGYTSGGGLSIAGGIANKKLHVNGGVSIGENYATNAIDANSLLVEGSFTLGTRSGTAATLSSFDSGGKLVNTTLGSGFSITSGTLNNLALTSLGGQTGATQTFAYGQSGTTPSWSSGSNVHTFRLPTATIGQLLVHNGTDWTAATPSYESTLTFNAPLSRSVNTISIPAASSGANGYLSSTDWNTFNAKVSGSGTATRVAFWSGTSTLSSNANLYWDNTNSRLGINNASPSYALHVNNTDVMFNSIRVGRGGGNDASSLAFGANTLTSNTGVQNIAIGSDVLASNTANNNVGIGYRALTANTSGASNLAIGASALLTNTSSSNNVSIGLSSLQTLNGGGSNLAIGISSLQDATSAWENVAIGRDGLRSTNGSGNAVIGFQGMRNNLTGNYNVAIGYQAGLNTLGSNNVFLGFRAGYSDVGSNRLMIQNELSSTPLIGGQFDNDRVGINRDISSISRTLHVGGEVRIDDLTTDTPTSWVGSDGDGDLANGSVGNGIALASGALGLTGQALALHNLSSNGLIARTSSGNVSARTITAGNGIAVTNGDGVSGNPTIAQATKYASAWANSEIFSLTASVVKKLDIYSSFVSSGITIDETDNWLEISETGVYEVTITGQYESNDQTGNYYLGIYKYNGSETGIAGGVLLKDPVGYVPFAYTSMHTFTAGDNVYAGLYCSTGETDDTVHNYRINMKRLY